MRRELITDLLDVLVVLLVAASAGVGAANAALWLGFLVAGIVVLAGSVAITFVAARSARQ